MRSSVSTISGKIEAVVRTEDGAGNESGSLTFQHCASTLNHPMPPEASPHDDLSKVHRFSSNNRSAWLLPYAVPNIRKQKGIVPGGIFIIQSSPRLRGIEEF